MRTSMIVVYWGLLTLGGACADASGPLLRLAPTIDAANARRSTANALALEVHVQARRADSVAIRFRTVGSAGRDSATPAVLARVDGTTVVPVLGLLPEEEYELRPIAYGSGGVTAGPWIAARTDALPADLPQYQASGTAPSPGFVALAAGAYGLVIDNSGRVVWYHRFDHGPWLNFMPHAFGRYVARLVTPDPTDVESWIEIDPLGNTTRTFGCHRNLMPRFHDLVAESDGGYWTLCDEVRTMDLSPYGGQPAARVTGTAVQHISGSGELLLHWSAFDHLDIADLDSASRAGPTVNWTHGNALAVDTDGNLLVSFRNLNEITKIHRQTGAVIWRLGGRRNQFALGDGSPTFAGQHSVRVRQPGQILLLDNVGDEQESHAEWWFIDAGTRSARVVTSFGAQPPVRTILGGSVQALPGDRTLVSYGTEGRVEEYDAAGAVVWRIDGKPGYVFRAHRFASLYRPGVR